MKLPLIALAVIIGLPLSAYAYVKYDNHAKRINDCVYLHKDTESITLKISGLTTQQLCAKSIGY